MGIEFEENCLWQDRELKFDAPRRLFELRKGERVLDSINSVEDTKGNNGMRGSLVVTNLRLQWLSHKSKRTNLSAIVKDKSLRILPGEEIYQTLAGVWNLSSEQGSLGTFVVTNIRIVWFADLANNFNVSIPYIQISKVAINDSRFGDALVVGTASSGGGYTLGFRIDPRERLARTAETITNLHTIFFKSPDFGVRVTVESAPQNPFNTVEKAAEEDLSIEENVDDFIPASFSAAPRGPEAYLAGGPEDTHDDAMDDEGKTSEARPDRQRPIYNAHLGLAVQPMPKGVTVQSLWGLMSSSSSQAAASGQRPK
ncbi:Bardet-Biedl syndrome 5 protein-like [Hondaea fermentalgiana]|uniref:Bardet-Biedl syndrome 5 protein-like n=1 Tax=Hondaea fermentalgiana TaxID=2315210 RepID=A0A2R5GA51_9STRA|nr:Bardet-Biedl syndrome 5 protein-like [Hondaea fermentalgiana]|eukprot:GBG24564.1 Bardet-Biedl syndrome 5 protein-like [Hondaea fermentalgiana]